MDEACPRPFTRIVISNVDWLNWIVVTLCAKLNFLFLFFFDLVGSNHVLCKFWSDLICAETRARILAKPRTWSRCLRLGWLGSIQGGSETRNSHLIAFCGCKCIAFNLHGRGLWILLCWFLPERMSFDLLLLQICCGTVLTLALLTWLRKDDARRHIVEADQLLAACFLLLIWKDQSFTIVFRSQMDSRERISVTFWRSFSFLDGKKCRI